MKKTICILTLILLVLSSGFSEDKVDSQEFEVVGFVVGQSPIQILEVSPYIYADANEERGINLDYENSTESYRHLITPTAGSIEAGLKIGSFNMMMSALPATLSITHQYLIKNGSPEITFDYQLAAEYKLSKGESVVSLNTQYALSDQAIVIRMPLSDAGTLYSIQNGSIYFRLTGPVGNGDYTSNITFTLAGI